MKKFNKALLFALIMDILIIVGG
ncbi:UNVERIFIED_CONTAM: peptide pheromone SHP2 [Streptococcus canis]|uniref:Peptide pheromone SHP2 n=1 Tax=Streptococcus canis TaxID=1329 RepID=A0AAE4Q3V5_STRCB|nr:MULTISPECIES: peptide pheromone SHP2 [Streptococcus]MCB2830377.1 peptide pheromone SHP2 [Streptococcus dysgalactiae subsp. dysgalactiae]MCB2832240.1 peptide pheromone SHP2 [Streptococcus dysgalactiae subsp. dysgalactiae]MCB2836081.1 peptide pheromone SHP2 [Streptococcus dysgalactiae subsp. dysgalactiae]MCB2838138.1 peptide pheromone SHP2 [Streptococcus dysgalactiae subsp. dysgalactiae]MCB2840053.1 peptide pheromone SHP2 [Streptococcus dysgalactiae subsp. dysgalactiae]